MKDIQKRLIAVCIGLIIASASCTGTPDIAPSPEAAKTNAVSGTPSPATPRPTATATITKTPTITPTATKVPDVELAQLQVDGYVFFSEIVNHLDVPVVFEDQQPALWFEVYDPLLDEHFQGEEPIDRYNSLGSVPCVIYPGETAFFYGGSEAYYQWFRSGGNSTSRQLLKFTYQSLGVPRPDWKENGTHYQVRDVTWRIDSKVLYFSFRHDPLHREYGGDDYFQGTMGLYDKDDHLLGVAGGWPIVSIDTGIADDFWISLNGITPGIYNRKEWRMAGGDEVKERLDHIKIMLEVLPGVDGICRKRVPTATP